MNGVEGKEQDPRTPAPPGGYLFILPDSHSVSDMADEIRPHYPGHIALAVVKVALLVVALPLSAAFISGYPPAPALALIASTLVIEYGAAPVGLALGLPPPVVLLTLCSIALGVTLFLFDAVDLLRERSEWIGGFLQRSAEKGRQSRILATYGIYGLVPCVMILGFYVCPPVAGIFGWRRDHSIFMIMAGYTGIAVVTILLTEGIFDIFFRQV